MILRNILMGGLCLTALALSAQEYVCHPFDPNSVPREHELDIENMKVEVSFEPTKALVHGKVTHTFKVLRKEVYEVFFDAPGIKIKSITMEGKALRYETSEKGVTVKFEQPMKWDEKRSIVFDYDAEPKRGIYFVGWNIDDQSANKNPYHTRRQIWTQGQGIDNRNWIPMYDDANDKFMTETVITFDKKYKVLSNGNLKSETTNSDGTKTWHYAMNKPHAGYLLMLAIGEYDIMKGKTKKGTPLNLYYYPDMADRAEPTYRYTSEMFDVIEAHTGIKYPWDSYSQVMVQDFIYGAMENTTATIFGDFFNSDKRQFLDRNYLNVNCHELTHQWFGDYITHRSHADIWLHESYATHFPKLFFREMYGMDEFQWIEYSEMKKALEASLKDNFPIRNTKAGSTRHYPKGSVVISMLKRVLGVYKANGNWYFNDSMGEASFNRALNYYMLQHAYANVETNDLYQAIQDKLGQSPYWFFDQWLYRGGEPEFEISYEKTASGNVRVHVKQTHKTDEVVKFFKMPVTISVYTADGKKHSMVNWIEAIEQQSFEIPVTNSELSFVVFDEGNTILKSLKFKRSTAELMKQAEQATHYIDRLMAVEALKSASVSEKAPLFSKIYGKENHHAIKAEILAQLSGNENSVAVFADAMKSKNVDVRKAAVSSSWNNATVISELEALLSDSSYKVCETALEKLIQFNPANTERYLDKTAANLGEGNANRIKWLEHAISYVYSFRGDDIIPAGGYTWRITDFIRELESYSGNAYEFHTRQNAFEALKHINQFNTNVFANLLDAATSWNGRLAAPASSTLDYFMQQTDNRRIASEYAKANSDKFSVKQKDLMKRYGLL